MKKMNINEITRLQEAVAAKSQQKGALIRLQKAQKNMGDFEEPATAIKRVSGQTWMRSTSTSKGQ